MWVHTKLKGEKVNWNSDEEWNIYLVLKYLYPAEYLLIPKGEKSDVAVEMPGEYHLYKTTGSKWTSSVLECVLTVHHLAGHTRKSTASLLLMLLPEVHDLNLAPRKHQINPEWGTFYRVTGLYIIFKSVKVMDIKESLIETDRVMRCDGWMQRMPLIRTCSKGHRWGTGDTWMDSEIRQ